MECHRTGTVPTRSLTERLRRRWHKEQFQPTWLGLFTNPFHFARRALHDRIYALAGHVQGKVLDVGCGTKPYRDLFTYDAYIGLEVHPVDSALVREEDVHYDGSHVPFQSACFDACVASQVLEHVFEPERFLEEIHRVLKDDGVLLLTVPFVWDEHEQPHDFARYTSYGLAYLLGKQGFQICEHHKSLGDMRAIAQMLNCYIHAILFRASSGISRRLLVLLLTASVNVLGTILSCALPGNGQLYLDNIILAKKIER